MAHLQLATTRRLLDADDEIRLAGTIEAGVLAADVLTGDEPYVRADAIGNPSRAELQLLFEEGVAAQRRFVESNLRMVSMVSHQAAARSGASGSTDLFQEGCLGLLTAVQRFDHRRGCRFSTYALYWVRAFVGDASATRLGELNLPPGRASRLRTIRGVAEAVGQSLGREATVAEVAVAVGRSEHWTGRLLASRSTVSLDAAESASVAEALVAYEQRSDLEVQQRSRLADRLLDQLHDQERQVLALRLGLDGADPMPYAQVARQLSLGVSRVRRIERSAIERLQDVCPASARQHL